MIHALKVNGQYKIISEDWKEADPKGFELATQQTQNSQIIKQ